MNRLNRTLFVSGMLALLVGVALFYPASSYASGGSTWSMTVTNPTQWPASVTFYYGASGPGTTAENSTHSINPGGFYTFKVPGAKCPRGLTGYLVMPDARHAALGSTGCGGVPKSPAEFMPCCWNVAMNICRKAAATADPYVRDNDYAFCKN